MEIYLGNPWKGAKYQVFQAWLRRRCNGDGVSVATEPGRQPQNVDLGDWFRIWSSDPALWQYRCHLLRPRATTIGDQFPNVSL